MSAESQEYMDLDSLNTQEDMDLLDTGTYPVTVKNAIWEPEKGYIMLFLEPQHDTGKEIEDVVEVLSFPKPTDTKRSANFKKERLTSWIAATGLAPTSIQDLMDPNVWKGHVVNAQLIIKKDDEYGTQNKVKGISTL